MTGIRKDLVAVAAALLAAGPAFAAAPKPDVLAAVRDDFASDLGASLRRAEVNARDEYGASALAWAVIRNAPVVVKQLLDAGADPNLRDVNGLGPLALAIEERRTEMVAALLAKGADPNAPRLTGETPLMTAVRVGSPEIVGLLLAKGADPNAREQKFGQTALMWAAGKPALVRLLLDKGADVRVTAKSWEVSSVNYTPVIGTLGSTGIPWVNAGEFVTRAGGETALIAAARAGDLESAQMLVVAGADVNQAAADGATPLLAALYNWRLVAPRTRMAVNPQAAAVGLDPNIPRPQFQPDVELAQFLLDHGAKADVADASGFTPLHAAVLMAKPPVGGLIGGGRNGAGGPGGPTPPKGEASALPLVRRLLQAGADPNRATLWPTPGPVGEVRISPASPGSTPMHVAAQIDSPALAELLAQFKGDPNRTRKDGHSPMSLAAKQNDVAVLKVLARFGGDFTKTYDPSDEIADPVESKTLQRRKQTLLHIAGAAGASDAVPYLASMGVPLEARNAQGETALDLADQQEIYRYKAKLEGAVGVGQKNVVRETRTTDAFKALGAKLGTRSAAASAAAPKQRSEPRSTAARGEGRR